MHRGYFLRDGVDIGNESLKAVQMFIQIIEVFDSDCIGGGGVGVGVGVGVSVGVSVGVDVDVDVGGLRRRCRGLRFLQLLSGFNQLLLVVFAGSNATEI